MEGKVSILREPTDRSELRDISSVKIDPALKRDDRIRSYIQQIGNPYCYLDGGTVVHISYSDTDVSLADRIRSYAHNLG